MKTAFLFALPFLMVSSAFAEDQTARGCEVYIEKVAAWAGSHGSRGVTLKLKTRNEVLDHDGGIESVGLEATLAVTPEAREFCRHTYPGSSDGCNVLGRTIRFPARKIGEDVDSFFVRVELKNDYTFDHVYLSRVFVRTKSGTRYVVTPSFDRPFVLDMNLHAELARLGSNSGPHLPEIDLPTVPTVPQLNPQGCHQDRKN